MKKKINLILSFLYICINIFPFVDTKNEMEVVKLRIVDDLLESDFNKERIDLLILNLNQNGFWDDINYKDLSKTAFENAKHTARLVEMSLAWRKPASVYYKSEELLKKIESALNFWAVNDFISENWWHNEIGIPNDLVNVLLLVGNELPEHLTQKIRPIVGRAHLGAGGARPSGDRIKIADIYARNVLFFNDGDKVGEVLKVIEDEIKFETGRGMQYDYSFHHRPDRVNNTLSYGLQFADVFTEWITYVAGTSYTFSDEKVKLLVNYYLDGVCKMMPFGRYPDLGAKNRSISRPGELRAMDINTPLKLSYSTDYRKKELQEIIELRSGKNESEIVYSKFFWHSEYLSHQRNNWFSSVRMYSERNSNMEEPHNNEGLLNHYLGDGANYIYKDGTEYLDIFPVFDWCKIPGTTILQKPEIMNGKEIQKKGMTSFVGAVSDGEYSAAAFDFISPHDSTQAKKSWFFFKDKYVCLGSGISSNKNYPVVTTLNQTLLKGNVIVNDNGVNRVLKHGNRELDSVNWIYHNGVTYMFPSKTNVFLSNGPQKGSWSDISSQSYISKDEISKDVFKLWIDHGTNPVNKSYEYIVIPELSEETLNSVNNGSTVEILMNNTEIQAVREKNLNIVQAIFYKAGTLRISHNITITAENPSSVMIEFNENNPVKITVSDPSRKLDTAAFTLSVKVESKPGMISVWNETTGKSHISIKLPDGKFAGSSRIICL